jgi:hypothetical protein
MNTIEKSPWLSINDMLIQNKCWLCEDVFPRGLKKKVFQVSHLTDYFYKRRLAEMKNEGLPQMYSRNLQRCYESYKALVPIDDIDNTDNLQKELQVNDVEVWMSGLLCGRTVGCMSDLCLILPENNRVEVSSKPTTAFAMGAIHGTAPDGSKECPPGCGCDNPWPFLS